METLDQILSYLDRLEGLSAVALVFLSCIVVGYAWRFIHFKWFPNDAIPVVCIVWGAFAMSLIADARASNMPFRVWFVRNIMVGGIIGLAAWAVHNYAIKRLEDYLVTLFPKVGDTVFFTKNQTTPEDKTNEKPNP